MSFKDNPTSVGLMGSYHSSNRTVTHVYKNYATISNQKFSDKCKFYNEDTFVSNLITQTMMSDDGTRINRNVSKQRY